MIHDKQGNMIGEARMDPTVDNAVNRANGTTQAAVARAPGRFRPFSSLARRIAKPGGGAAGSRRDAPELTARAAQPDPINQAQRRAEVAARIGSTPPPNQAGQRQHLQTQASPTALRNRAEVASQQVNRAAGTAAGGLVAGEELEE